MKWTLGQLAKMQKPIIVNYTLDLTNSIDKMGDVISISPVVINGEGYEMGFDEYVFSLDVECILTMPCAITLENVDVNISFHTDEVFKTENNDGDDVNLVKNETINLDDIILANIILRIPMKVVKEGVVSTFKESEEKDECINPAFADLDKFFK